MQIQWTHSDLIFIESEGGERSFGESFHWSDLTNLFIFTIVLALPLLCVKSKHITSFSIQNTFLPEVRFAKEDRLLPQDRFLPKEPAFSESRPSVDQTVLAKIIMQSGRSRPSAYQLAGTIIRESERAEIDPYLTASIILAESSFRENARSSVGALGLMQVRPLTGRYIAGLRNIKWHGPQKLKDPSYNITLGIAYLKHLQRRFRGNLHHALIAYNWGPTNLSESLKKNRRRIPKMSVHYSQSIQKTHQHWRNRKERVLRELTQAKNEGRSGKQLAALFSNQSNHFGGTC